MVAREVVVVANAALGFLACRSGLTVGGGKVTASLLSSGKSNTHNHGNYRG